MPLLRAAIVLTSASSIASIMLDCWAGAVCCVVSSAVGNALSGIGGLGDNAGVTWLGEEGCGSSCRVTAVGAVRTGIKTYTGGRVSPFLRSNVYRRTSTAVGVVGHGAGVAGLSVEVVFVSRGVEVKHADCFPTGKDVAAGWSDCTGEIGCRVGGNGAAGLGDSSHGLERDWLNEVCGGISRGAVLNGACC
jgi:hypothetical protein